MTYDVFADDSEHVVIGYQQMRIGYIAYCLGIPASTLAGLRDGSLVAVPREPIARYQFALQKRREARDHHGIDSSHAIEATEEVFDARSKVLAAILAAAAPAPKGGEHG